MSIALFRRSAASFAAALLLSMSAQAQDFKPIRWLVPYPAGGGTDVVARAIASR